MVIPAADPVWIRNSSIESYGGSVDKKNYGGIGNVDNTTDESAEQFSSNVDHVQAMAKTAAFAFINLTCNDSSPGAPTINEYSGEHGSTPPAVARVGAGHITVTFDSFYVDSYGQEGTVNLSAAVATVHGSAFGVATVNKLSANSWGIYVWGSGGSAASDKTLSVVFY